MKDTIKLLRKAAVQFRYYAQQHLNKTRGNRGKELGQAEIKASLLKHEINLRLAEEIEDHLAAIELAAMEPSPPRMLKPITE